jgi:hypothetical protein
MSQDNLRVQLSIAIKLPEGVRVTKGVLQGLIDRLIAGKSMPKNVRIRAIAWRNGNRRGDLALWRWAGPDPSGIKGSRETSPRGSLRSAIDTLAPFLETGDIAF